MKPAKTLLTERMKGDPRKIIAWAKKEIKEYEKLIKLVEKKSRLTNSK